MFKLSFKRGALLSRSSIPSIPSIPSFRTYLTSWPAISSLPRLLPVLTRDIIDYNWINEEKSINEYLKTKEESNKYIVTINDPKIKDKTLTLKYLKYENALLVNIKQNINNLNKNSESIYQSLFESKYYFNQPINYKQIKANNEKDEGIIEITIPKLQDSKEDENIINIPFKSSHCSSNNSSNNNNNNNSSNTNSNKNINS
ncbi:unnamed protein product [Candida verbasci]|uniref:SHSP domain-containing protein n=1 Tax=Candida verbasci TaxID=1227364 RepID=A0A9W4U2W3_9ASCO|nr:unnamed protein product [Candida verbasci]